MNLRKPAIEEVTVPASTYGAHPAVPHKPLHTVGSRGVVIANGAVSAVAIRRLLEVLYESDFARRVGVPPLAPSTVKIVPWFSPNLPVAGLKVASAETSAARLFG